MKTPLALLQDIIIVPVYKFHKNYLSRNAMHKYCKKVANFVFDCSKETALIMLFFNAVSILSSHLSQIGGLKRSKRENKDYLITQEKQELGLDLILTIIPPFMLNNFLKKKLESGAIATKESREKLINFVAPVVGASRDELYSTDHIRPIKETLGVLITKCTSGILQNSKKLPKGLEQRIRAIDKKVKSELPDFALRMPVPSLEDIATDFDNMAQKKRISSGLLKKVRNGSAYDDLCGQNNGILIMTTIAYTILASNVIMPILKNKLSNRSYEKQLAAMGETKESIKRKKRFAYNSTPVQVEHNNNLFNDFLASDIEGNKLTATFNTTDIKEPQMHNNYAFDVFNSYNKLYTQSTGLRI